MGEYAKRLSDGEDIKIGTCEEMYYLRFEDRFKVAHIPGNVDIARHPEDCRFRLPFADEDKLEPGEYEGRRSQRLYKPIVCDWCDGTGKNKTFPEDCRRCYGSGIYDHEDFAPASLEDKPGRFQMTHKSGLIFSIPCHHGMKLPDLGPNIKPAWNGKGWSTELSSIRIVKQDGYLRTYPVVRCRHCEEAWRFEWPDVWDYIPEGMKSRCIQYRNTSEVLSE